MKNTKITFKWTASEDKNEPNNNYNAETDYIVCEKDYEFSDYLIDRGVRFEQEDTTYYIITEDNERTGEAYMVISEEETDEDLIA